MNRKQLLTKELNSIKVKLIKDYQPEKIVVFGSFNDGQINKNSDLDLMVIKKTSFPFLERLKEVSLLVRPKVAVDFLVYTPEEYQTMQRDNNYFIKEINKGKVIYERQ